MMKNIMVLLTVAVLGGSQVVGMNVVKSDGMSSMENTLDQLNKALKKGTERLKETMHNNMKSAKRKIIEETVNMPKKQHAVLIPAVETKKQGFFRSLYNKVVQNKGKVAAGVVGMTLLAGAAYYMLSNPVSAVQPVSSAFKSCYDQELFLGAMIPSNVCYYAAQFNKNFQNIIL